MIKSEIQDVFEFLICILTSQKKGCDTVEIDDEEYIIHSKYLDEKGEIGLMMCLYTKDDHVVIEFKKTKGDQSAYFEKTKSLKEEFLTILGASTTTTNEAKKQKVEVVQQNTVQEEQKVDD